MFAVWQTLSWCSVSMDWGLLTWRIRDFSATLQIWLNHRSGLAHTVWSGKGAAARAVGKVFSYFEKRPSLEVLTFLLLMIFCWSGSQAFFVGVWSQERVALLTPPWWDPKVMASRRTSSCWSTPTAKFIKVLPTTQSLGEASERASPSPESWSSEMITALWTATKMLSSKWQSPGQGRRMPCAAPLRITRYAVWIFSLFPSCTFNLWQSPGCVLENFTGSLTSRNLFALSHGFCNFIKLLKRRGSASTRRGAAFIWDFQGWKYVILFYPDVYRKINPWKKSNAYNESWRIFKWNNSFLT